MARFKVVDCKPGHGWAWAIRDEVKGGWCLCYWAKSDKQRMLEQGPPSPEARLIPVRLVPMAVRRG